MSQIEKGGVIESMVISYMILQGDSFGLSHAYYVNDLDVLLLSIWLRVDTL